MCRACAGPRKPHLILVTRHREDRDPWDALSPEEQTQILRQMVANQVERATTAVLSAARP